MIKIKSFSIVSVAIIGITMQLPFMREINSYVFIFAFLLLPITLGIWLLIKSRTTCSQWLTYFVISMILGYAFIVLSAWSLGWHYEYELNKYDLDGDGMFSGDEICPDMEKAMDRLTNDTGRTFAPITAAIVSPFYHGFWLVFFALLANIQHRITTIRNNKSL